MPSKRYITLGDGRACGLGTYVKAWRAILTLPERQWLVRCPDGYGGTASDALRQLRDGMHDRINRHIPGYGKGRKWDSDWQRTMTQSAHALNTPRLIIDWLPADLKARFAYRLRVNRI